VRTLPDLCVSTGPSFGLRGHGFGAGLLAVWAFGPLGFLVPGFWFVVLGV
jgi:hypothetical protein